MIVKNIREHFINALANEQFVVDKTGQKTIELIGASFEADESTIFGTPNKEYIKAEIDWYHSQSLNINDINKEKQPPKAWTIAANKYGEINSNYGHVIYNKKYFNQYQNVIRELSKNPDGRRATMIYNRPSMWYEYNEAGKNDFICTNAVNYYLRDNTLNCVVQMRSNDVVYGYKNDRAWQEHVLYNLSIELQVKLGRIYWQVGSLHVYEQHFGLVK